MQKRDSTNKERGPDETKISQRKAMALHGKHFAALPSQQRRALSSQAIAARTAAEASRKEQIETVQGQLSLERHRREQIETTHGPTMKISSCRLPTSAWERVSEIEGSITRRSELATAVKEGCAHCPVSQWPIQFSWTPLQSMA